MGSRVHKKKRTTIQPKESNVVYDVASDYSAPTISHVKFESINPPHHSEASYEASTFDTSHSTPVNQRAPSDFKQLSQRQQRKAIGWSIGKLKLMVDRPELVETHDVNAQYPIALLHIRSTRNVAKVPQNWCIRRKYLSRKRQLSLLTNYELPPQLAATRVASIRKYYVDRARAQLSGKPAPHEEAPRPDFDAIRDCFYHYTFVNLYKYGDLYYEGREAELDSVDARPNILSNRLRAALHMPLNVTHPPPWLTHMQVHGPPPGYPTKKFPGVNAPLPKGERWGHETAQWGRPPTDGAHPRGKWGDLFVHISETPSVMKTLWEKAQPKSTVKSSTQLFSTVLDNRWEKIVGVTAKRGQVSSMGEFTTQRRAVVTAAKPVVDSKKLPEIVTVRPQQKQQSFAKPIDAKHAESQKGSRQGDGQKKQATSMRF